MIRWQEITLQALNFCKAFFLTALTLHPTEIAQIKSIIRGLKNSPRVSSLEISRRILLLLLFLPDGFVSSDLIDYNLTVHPLLIYCRAVLLEHSKTWLEVICLEFASLSVILTSLDCMQ